MSPTAPEHATLADWIAREAIPFSPDSDASFNAAVDRVFSSLGESVELLGFGEALHGCDDMLVFRNRLFRRLVETHGYSAIAIESSFPRGRLVNEYIAGRGPASYEAIQETGFSHGFGPLAPNRELVEWMRTYNADASHRVKLRFYGFDSPSEMTSTDSPRQVLRFVLDYFAAIDPVAAEKRRTRIEELIGQDADWENPAVAFEPAKGIGLSPAATALRIETEELISELHVRRPELTAKSDADRYAEAMQYASVARQLLNYHAGLAGTSSNRLVELLGIRDAMMADNLAYMVARERGRGRVFTFAHNSHLKCGRAEWQLGPQLLAWWPAGSHVREMFGSRYAVIGSAVGVSESQGIGPPEAGTLETRLAAVSAPSAFIATHKGEELPAAEVATLPTRSGSGKNSTYFPLTAQSLTDFDWLVVVNQTAGT
jgi:erythromycin esterase-like protein